MLFQDLRQSLRALIRAPGYTLIAVATLALGIGVTTAIYTVLEKVALDPLPYPEADRLVRLANLVPGVGEGARWDLSMAQYFFYGEHAGAIEAMNARAARTARQRCRYVCDTSTVSRFPARTRYQYSPLSFSRCSTVIGRFMRGGPLDAHAAGP